MKELMSNSKDYEAGRQYVMYMFGQDAIPSVKFFGDLLIQKKDLSEDQIITSFLIVALACFLCPNSSLIPSVKYLTIFEDANLLKSYDWSKFVYEWLMTYAKKFQKNNTIGGCLFYWAALYLDNVDFGSRYIDQGLPRISVWKDDMISVFSDLDKIDDNTFGLRPLKDFRATCYFQPEPTHSRSNAIRAKLDSAIGSMIPDCLKEKISELLSSHFCSHHVLDSEPCEDILISILALLAESSQFLPLEVPTTHISPQINTEAGPSNREPTSPKARQSDFCVLNDDGVRSPAKHTSLSNVELYEKSVSRSIGKGCTSLDRIADLYGSIANCDDDSMLLNNLSAHPKVTTAVVTPCGNANASSSHEDEPLLTPDVAYLRTRYNILNETNEGPSFAALSLVKNVANKFRSRITHFNSRTPFLGEEMPSFKLLDSDDDVTDCDKENEVAEAITPACSQDFLSFHSVEDTPDDMIRGNSNLHTSLRNNCGNMSKRILLKFSLLASQNLMIVSLMKKIDTSLLFVNLLRVPSDKALTQLTLEHLIADPSICDMEKVKKSFLGASKARELQLCDMLHFPIYFNQHWFLFIVDIKDRMLVFLDSLHNEGDDFFRPIMAQLKANLQTAWDKFVCSPMDFRTFKTVFPPVPRQNLRSNFLVLAKQPSNERV
uniref:Ubiquitin-like protease family profile domain-containing protein n=1 Tax=Oryza meridionalis TaxID=40149 RepID=A0A0E0E7W6_9ORYZ